MARFPSDLDGNLDDTVPSANRQPDAPQQPTNPEGHVARQLQAALDDPRWDFRTIDGLAAELGVQPDLIVELLARHGNIARKSILRSSDGRELYAGRTRRPTVREKLERIRSLLAQEAALQ